VARSGQEIAYRLPAWISLHLLRTLLWICVACSTPMNMKTKPPQVHKIWMAQPEAFVGKIGSLAPVQNDWSQNKLPFILHSRGAPSAQGGKVLPVEVHVDVAPAMISSHVPQHSFQDPVTKIAIGWMLTRIPAMSVRKVGPCTCQQLPRRLALHRQYTNCARLVMTVNINATWKPWKKSTAPVPAPPFMKEALTFSKAARTMGQHQAPTIAGTDNNSTPTEPMNCAMPIGSLG
jgi:hypothetical protein